MRLRIAICDDVPADLAAIRSALDGFLAERGLSADVSEFSHPDALLEGVRKEPFGLYLLDVVLPMVTGIGVMREIRRTDAESPVVYFSMSREFALEAFGVQAVNYLVKPFTRTDFDQTLARVFKSLDRTEEKTFSVKTPEGVILIPFDDLVAVTASETRNFLTLRLSDGTTREVRETMSGFYERLGPQRRRFFAAGHQAIVNLAKVRAIDKTLVRLMVGKPIAIPKASVVPLRQAVIGL